MVAAEAAAAGALPVSAAHSGLAEVTRDAGRGRAARGARRGCRSRWATTPCPRWRRAGGVAGGRRGAPHGTRAALVRVARERYSWEGVAEGVVAAAQGRLDVLAPVR